jgi:hypothetical protein
MIQPMRSALIPCGETELHLLLGWQLCDEPVCGHVRMLPPEQGGTGLLRVKLCTKSNRQRR